MNLKNFFLRKEPAGIDDLTADGIPYHVAVIMDGNGRWAKKRGLPRIAGHRAGMESVKNITRAANEIGIRILTLYAFSTENWKRPEQEVDFLMRLPQEFLLLELETLKENNIRIQILGDTKALPDHTRSAVEEAVEKTADNTGMLLNIALNYGSRSEILEAIKSIAEDVRSGVLAIEDIDEEELNSRLLTEGIPDPDLLIRTSGELRLSNFLLWQCAYTELWFTDVLWPDFKKEHFYEAIRAYKKRGRRFGGLK
ncbi:isoprenyl transferase [Effusibacillus lacus]|uniref:Isoprenyl transferase n=1 Tax=Effusibacillus lacus TaxID=1348429 RepID=A0A292YHU2_9BACL|nr:isoprenyl transferase [Effusibacillus lacus]TCS73154.1 undecaprenyl pyrophosphate synthetase [Effusibacillus lacus]GAX90557.1 isoprenyl transferase [Effusibacillus lacus]